MINRAADYPVSPRGDAYAGLALLAFGGLVVLLSWQMDRMEQQGANLYGAPGLWPGLVGLVTALLGLLLAWRARERAARAGWNARAADDTALASTPRFVLAVALMFAYAVLLVGRGLPFWLGTALFVSAYVVIFREVASKASGGRARSIIVAATVGGITSLVVVLVFEQLFFVRLP